QVLQGKLNRLPLDVVVDDLEYIRLAVIDVHGIALQGKNVVVFRSDDCDSNIDVGQQTKILILDQACGLTHVAVAARLHRGRHAVDHAGPSAAGHGIPCDFDALRGLQPANIGFVDKSANQNVRQIGLLQE